jgi:hypothetical protein
VLAIGTYIGAYVGTYGANYFPVPMCKSGGGSIEEEEEEEEARVVFVEKSIYFDHSSSNEPDS